MKLKTLLLPCLLAIASLPTRAADTGDYDGGGGGTLPANPLKVDEIYEIAHHQALRDLRLVFRVKEITVKSGYGTKLQKKLFGGEKNVLTLLEESDLEVLMSQPCHDKFGREVDASVHASRPGTICLSAFRVAPKVVKETARKEVFALLAHELSHLLGTNEEEAREFQGDIASSLEDSHPDFAAELINGVGAKLSIMGQNLWDAKRSRRQDAVKFADRVNAFEREFFSLAGLNYARGQSLYDYRESEYLKAEKLRARLFALKAGSMTGLDGSDVALREYEKAFGGKSEVTVAEAAKNLDRDDEYLFGNQKIRRLETKEEVWAALEDFSALTINLNDHLLRFTNGLSLEDVFGRMPDASPWNNFLSAYTVTHTECDEDPYRGGRKKFSVVRPEYDPERPYLRYETANGFGDIGVYDGAADTHGGAAVRVNGGTEFAERVAQFGTAWGEQWSKNTFRLERSTEGYRLVETQYSRTRTKLNTFERKSTCVFTLRRD